MIDMNNGTHALVPVDRLKPYRTTKEKINSSKTDKANKNEFTTDKENNTTINKNTNNNNNSSSSSSVVELIKLSLEEE